MKPKKIEAFPFGIFSCERLPGFFGGGKNNDGYGVRLIDKEPPFTFDYRFVFKRKQILTIILKLTLLLIEGEKLC